MKRKERHGNSVDASEPPRKKMKVSGNVDEKTELDTEEDFEGEEEEVSKRKFYLQKGLKKMMFAFGDVENPLDESSNMLEDVLVLFLKDLMGRCREKRGGKRIVESDILYQIRKDNLKYSRANEIIRYDKEISSKGESYQNRFLVKKN